MKALSFQSKLFQAVVPLIVFLLGIIVVLRVTSPVWQHQQLNDDSFITLTYAKNLAQGNGFVYNQPPATLGTTTPLFTILTALLAVLLPFFSIIDIAILFSIAAWLATAGVLYLLMEHIGFEPILASIIAVVPMITSAIWINYIGMEIWLFEFLLVLTVYLTLTQRLFMAGLAVGGLFLTRGEGILLAGILFGYLLRNKDKNIWRFALGITIILSAWFVYALDTFGTILPNTLAAKQARGDLPNEQLFIERLWQVILPVYLYPFELFGSRLLNSHLILAAIGLVGMIRQAKVLLIFVVWIVIL